MRVFQSLVILILLGLIVGVGYGSYWFLYAHPRQQDAFELAQAGPPGQPPPDPSTPDYEKIRALLQGGNREGARQALEAFLLRFPDGSHLVEAEALLGNLNIQNLFSGDPGPGKIDYVVKRGDNLYKLANHLHTPAELIFRASNLDSIALQIGQRLEIPQLDVALEVRRGERKVVVLNHGQLFRVYPVRSLRFPGKKGTEIKTRVVSKAAYRGGRPVKFNDRDFEQSTRVINLAQSGVTIFGETGTAAAPAPAAANGPSSGPGPAVMTVASSSATAAGPSSPPPPPEKPGIGLNASDVEELYLLVSPGTPVTVVPD